MMLMCFECLSVCVSVCVCVCVCLLTTYRKNYLTNQLHFWGKPFLREIAPGEGWECVCGGGEWGGGSKFGPNDKR